MKYRFYKWLVFSCWRTILLLIGPICSTDAADYMI